MLTQLGLKMRYPVDVVHARWARLGSKDRKHVEIWEHLGRRIDLFFLQ